MPSYCGQQQRLATLGEVGLAGMGLESASGLSRFWALICNSASVLTLPTYTQDIGYPFWCVGDLSSSLKP